MKNNIFFKDVSNIIFLSITNKLSELMGHLVSLYVQSHMPRWDTLYHCMYSHICQVGTPCIIVCTVTYAKLGQLEFSIFHY